MTNQEIYCKRLYKELCKHPSTISAKWENSILGYTRYEFKVKTTHGDLVIYTDDEKSACYHIHCRFEDITHKPWAYSANPHSGKWNHYLNSKGTCPRWAADEMVDMINTVTTITLGK